MALSRLVYGDRNWHLARANTKLASAYFDLKGLLIFLNFIIDTTTAADAAAAAVLRICEIGPSVLSTGWIGYPTVFNLFSVDSSCQPAGSENLVSY